MQQVRGSDSSTPRHGQFSINAMTDSSVPLARQSVKQHGFTLIEMMISITIGLGILAGLVGVLASSSGNSRSNDRTAELLTNGRYALNSIKQEARQAGFRGYTWAEPGTPNPWVAPANASGCYEAGSSAGGFVSNIRQAVWGANDANPFSTTCIPNESYSANNDVLVIRRLASIPSATLAANTVYFQSTYERGQIFRGATPPVFSGTPTPLASFSLQTYIYYVSPFTVSATESPLVPALFRMSLGVDGNMSRELVASGVERMQVQYGRLSTALDTQYLNAGVAPLNGGSADTTATGWDDIHSVRIWLLTRTAAAEPGYKNTDTYQMGDQTYTVDDGFRRQIFTAVVQLRN